jgi:UDP:flavonoid glycosyltransferase YjiC (YdhE family)
VRVLLTTSPGIGHLFPAIPLAHAFRAAGHDVLLATSGQATTPAANAGLPVYDVAPGVDMRSVFTNFHADVPFDHARTAEPEDAARFGAELFAHVSDVMADGAVRVARAWRPDLVVHSSLDGTGPLVASMLGVPAVLHGFGLLRGPQVGEALRERMGETYRRHGVTGEPAALAALDVAPPSMGVGEAYGIGMRYVAYNGGGVLPEWALDRPRRPRIAVTLGTVVPQFGGVGSLDAVVRAAGGLDAEFVLALGDADPSPLGELPDNVRVSGWIPLGALLWTCSLVVHHGGAGTTLTTVGAGLPHVVLPSGADQFINAEAVRKRGIGVTPEPSEVDADLFRDVLADDGLRAATAEVRAEMERLPGPVDVVPRLLALAG